MKIGFCFLIYDKIYNKGLWNKFFQNVPINKYGIYIHSKLKCDDKLKNALLFENEIESKWADISLVYLIHFLFRKAMKDGCDYFLLLSGDTIPLYSFYNIKKNLNQSIFSVQKKENIPVVYKNFNKKSYNNLNIAIKNKIKYKKYRKQNMFFGITKNDFLKIKKKKEYIEYFKKCIVPDEFYFINLFYILKLKYKDNYIYISDDLYRTQSRLLDCNKVNFREIKKNNYLFCRKIIYVPPKIVNKYLF